MDPLIVLFRLGVGLLVGTTGVGGGSVTAAAVLFTAGVMFARTLFVPQAVDRERDQVDPFAAKDKIAAVVMGLSVVLSSRLPVAGLRLALGAILLAASLGLLTKAGLAIPPGLIVVIPIAVGLSAWLYARRGRRAPPRLASPSSSR